MSKWLFVGYPIPPEDVPKTPGASVAGNKMQYHFLRELTKLADMEAITVFPLAAYPGGKRLTVKKHRLELYPGFETCVPGYLNLPIIKVFSSGIRVARELRRMKEKPEKVIVFNMYPYTAWPVLRMKKRCGYEVITLLADLPIDENVNGGFLSRFLIRMMNESTKKAIRKSDRIIALNPEAAKQFAPGIPYCVMEGGVDESSAGEPIREKKRKNILYSGSLQAHNGVDILLKAMAQLDGQSDLELDIYGGGELTGLVEDAASRHHNIRYCGKVDNETMMRLQREAYLLINPRDPENPISRVTFPSKTFEYLLSGTPVISTRLNGYSQEYLDSMILIDRYDTDSFVRTLTEAGRRSPEELAQTGENARRMVMERKNWKTQTERVFRWIKDGQEKEPT